MKPKGEDTASAIREWMKDEIKNARSFQYDLGKFFFGVSSASLAVLVGLKRLDESLRIDWTVGISLALLGFSALVALLMVIPE